MRLVYLAIACLLVSCAEAPMTPDEAAAYQQAAGALRQGGQDLRQQQGSGSSGNCQLVQYGGGVYQQNCH